MIDRIFNAVTNMTVDNAIAFILGMGIGFVLIYVIPALWKRRGEDVV